LLLLDVVLPRVSDRITMGQSSVAKGFVARHFLQLQVAVQVGNGVFGDFLDLVCPIGADRLTRARLFQPRHPRC
jgi:hypothetical protein